MKAEKKPKARFKVGDRVRFNFPRYKVWGTITEDHGAIGVNGRRLYTVSKPSDPFEPDLYALPEDELEPDTTPPASLEKAEIIEFLKEGGGLLWILMTNPSEGRKDPQVWLARDQLGGVTFTFERNRGMIGGETVPFSAFWGSDAIYAPKKDEVAEFLLSFGLTHEEAEDVIRAVGVSPVKKRHGKAETA